MKKFLIVFMIFCLNLPVMAETKLLHSYPDYGIYYYYVSDMDIKTFKKPKEVVPDDSGYYTLYIYNKPLKVEKFKKFRDMAIKNNAGYLLEMHAVGFENKPSYYLTRSKQDRLWNPIEVYLCKFNHLTKYQTKYALNPERGKFEKQVVFKNGNINFGSACNPDFLPWQDI